MKRQGTKAQDQPVAKKPDGSVSTDLRSKISAKLQTLLNGISSDSALYIQHKRQLYADLFREPQYSEIIIDPTIVVKIEDPDTEESSDTLSHLSAENFLTSAKSKITELLNKQQDSEKENSKECIPSSSQKPKPSSSSSKGKCRNSNISDSSSVSHSDVLINQGQLQSCSVSVEDVVLSKSRTKSTRSQSKAGQTITSSPKASVKDSNKPVKCNHDSNSLETNSNCELCSSLMMSTEIHSISNASDKRFKNCKKNISTIDLCDVSESTYSSFINSDNIDTSENKMDSIEEQTIDDPEVCLTVEENVVLLLDDTISESIPSDNQDEDVVLLCEKRPTYDVITLEEDEDSGDIVEEVQRCNQCGKTFRAKSLLTFHLRMHGSHISQTSFPSN